MSHAWLIAAVTWPQAILVAIWSGLVVSTIALPVLMRSRWGAAQPLRRCVVLSIWAHVLLAAFATTVPVMRTLGPPGWGDGPLRVSVVTEGDATDDVAGADQPPTWTEPNPDSVPIVDDPPVESPRPVETPPAESEPPRIDPPAPTPVPPEVIEPSIAPSVEAAPPVAVIESVPSPIEAAEPLVDVPSNLVAVTEPAQPGIAPSVPLDDVPPRTDATPREYQWRQSTQKAAIVAAGGGSPDTEAAVAAALAWLASAQSPDGRWDADQLGAGRGSANDGVGRSGAGTEADTGITGLALLAFLASGHTHQSGQYQKTVDRGLRFLVNSQAENGNLSGRADVFAAMYCHGMAGIAVAEAYGMTADESLRRPVERAVMYTLASQHPQTGGWRYRPGDLGDTSQLGWQLMLLRSARIAGVNVPDDAFVGVGVFLRHVSAGQHGGLAAYRFGERVSNPMTAEALLCRQFLGMSRDDAKAIEATEKILTELPGTSDDNFYYWYYGTLALYQQGGGAWDTWNRALQERLLSAQQSSGRLAGSWEPDPIWGGYGGRVYSTALATLSLEVYYRYLPVLNETAAVKRRAK